MSERKDKAADKGFAGFIRKLGPGLTTGASDDDPSGIATYSQAGAAFGCGLLWTMLFSLPFMCAIQEASARLGRITGQGIAHNIRRYYSPWLLYPTVSLLAIANTINLGADIGAMGDVLKMIAGGSAQIYCMFFVVLCLYLQIFLSYARYSQYLKWLTLVLFSYVAVVFVVHAPWKQALHQTLIPTFERGHEYWAVFVALLGTTISPYMFFWQAAMETEEIKNHHREKKLKSVPSRVSRQFSRIRWDTYVGMTFSNLIGFFIILAAAATLNAHHVNDIQTSSQAAEALKPLAGNFAFVLFALGIVGTGLLTVPVLSGSAAYAVAETLRFTEGLNKKPHQAKAFYGVLIIATLLGLAINFPQVQHHTHLSPVKMLFWSAVINGLVAAPIMAIIMLMHQNPRIGGKLTSHSPIVNLLGWLAVIIMLFASVGLFVL